jgi:tRNA-specific 2-thiouridylase
MCKTIAVALSGGIDSLVAAALLKNQGHALIGLHFLSGYETENYETTRAAADQADFASIKEQVQHRLSGMTEQLRLPIYVIDLRSDFKSRVVDYLTNTYQTGKTPNPCLVCNSSIKFGVLLNKAKSLGATHLATGHYARIRSAPDGRMQLLRGKDPYKEQSYFLSRLTQKQLTAAVMPLGDLTKDQTREIAFQQGLQPVATQESQDICFIKGSKYGQFIARQPGFQPKPGPIEDTDGKLIGRHNGLHLFTIGQRRGINCPASEPYYVVHIDTKRNCLVVGFQNHLQTRNCRVSGINWIIEPPVRPCDITIRVRYRHNTVSATLAPIDSACADIAFKAPQKAVSPGQGAVFYHNNEVLGGGWIE